MEGGQGRRAEADVGGKLWARGAGWTCAAAWRATSTKTQVLHKLRCLMRLVQSTVATPSHSVQA
jgi:hypothetical protein